MMLVGDRAKDQVSTINWLMNQDSMGATPNVLWCYNKDLGFSSSKKKRVNQLKRCIASGSMEGDDLEDSFELFLRRANVRWCYYKDVHKVLGQTFNMLVVQDFEALSPNFIARTVETVKGGGVVLFLINKMSNLKQLYTIKLEAHARYRMLDGRTVEPRFTERFLLSLKNCSDLLVADDELNILPIYKSIDQIKLEKPGDVSRKDLDQHLSSEQKLLKKYIEDTKDNQVIHELIKICVTGDQCKVTNNLVGEMLGFKNGSSAVAKVVSITSARGRGKTSTLGLALAAAIHLGFSNVFVTAPSPENIQTMWEFILNGLKALNYKEFEDYTVLRLKSKVETNSKESNRDQIEAIVQISFKKKQYISFIAPYDVANLAYCDMLVVDEAAAIPLTYVRALLDGGSYMKILSSTVNGYEGTGRSLSLKLLAALKEAGNLTEFELASPIRYNIDDRVESWMNDMLLLNHSTVHGIQSDLTAPDRCPLYYVNKDTLFSSHRKSEYFLRQIYNIMVSSHYKNSPNDIQLLSDNPAHGLFVLTNNFDEEGKVDKHTVDVYCVIQFAIEGKLDSKSISKGLGSREMKPSGDLVSWILSEQFQEPSFAEMLGIRIVRIATHTQLQGMGYGKRAMELVSTFFANQLVSSYKRKHLFEIYDNLEFDSKDKDKDNALVPRVDLNPLFISCEKLYFDKVEWVGTSFGLTDQLFRFWSKSNMAICYTRLSPNEQTGEYTCIMLKFLDAEKQYLNLSKSFNKDFLSRFSYFLSSNFRTWGSQLVYNIFNESKKVMQTAQTALEKQNYSFEPESCFSLLNSEPNVLQHFTLRDLQRLQAYTANKADYHLVVDMIQRLMLLFVAGKFRLDSSLNTPADQFVNLSPVQTMIMIATALQMKSIDAVSKEINVSSSQILSLFNKCIRKLYTFLNNVVFKSLETDKKEGEKGNNRMMVDDNDMKNIAKETDQDLSDNLKRKRQDKKKI